MISKFESIRSMLKDDFYSFLKLWEPLMIGFVVKNEREDGFEKLYDSTLEEMNCLLRNNEVSFDVTTLMPDITEDDDVKMHLELLGSIKHFGHPCLKVLDGFSKVREVGSEATEVDLDVVDCAVSIMRRDFVKNYLVKKRKWPPVDYIPKELDKFFKKGTFPSHMNTDYKVWGQVKFSKVFEYDYSPNTSELIKDSAAANELDNWSDEYDHCAFKILYGKNKPRVNRMKKPTRVVPRFLVGEEHELEKKIFELDNNYYDKQDNIAVLCRKEQELSKNGRLFVKQSFVMRLAQTSMENNLAKQYFRYVPEQTMTSTEVDLMRRLDNAARQQHGNLFDIINLDLNKWNQRFRHALVSKFGEVLDELFGFKNLYKNNHYWFLLSHVFCNSRLHPPDYDENKMPIPGLYFYLLYKGKGPGP